MSPIYMKYSKHFLEYVEQRDIDISAVVDVVKKLNNAKIEEIIKGGMKDNDCCLKRFYWTHNFYNRISKRERKIS